MKNIIKGIFGLSFLMLLIMNVHTAEASSNKDATLKKEGYTEEDINRMNEITKNQLIENHGTKAKYEVTVTEYYNSLDGKKYKVTDQNREKINEIRKQDAAKYAAEKGISIMEIDPPVEGISTLAGTDTHEDDKLLFSAFVEKSRTVGSEYEYAAFLDFTWKKTASMAFYDEIALAWDNRFIGLAKSLSGYYVSPSGNQGSKLSKDQELYGITARFPLIKAVSGVMGGISQDIRVGTNYKGKTGKFQAKYVHTLIPFPGSVSLGPASVDIPAGWSNQEFTLDFNLTIGS
ncbi:hypothetical protein SB775_25840 [Peribacillus sp. SIMBA_075]|uniref:hypothetical protein n=1 Tax=Peribacillus sp. SIMBA_075 TaxID=3085813 RepID=UPI00397BDE0A